MTRAEAFMFGLGFRHYPEYTIIQYRIASVLDITSLGLVDTYIPDDTKIACATCPKTWTWGPTFTAVVSRPIGIDPSLAI